jgi:hypothetical protein
MEHSSEEPRKPEHFDPFLATKWAASTGKMTSAGRTVDFSLSQSCYYQAKTSGVFLTVQRKFVNMEDHRHQRRQQCSYFVNSQNDI